MARVRIGVIGDFKPENPTHRATAKGLAHAAEAMRVDAEVAWLPTPSLNEEDGANRLAACDALFASPGSPYRSFDGALAGIRFARERGKPFVGT